MQFRSGNEIREAFLHFFETKGHRRVHSSSLVPANDPTLLFTNAGMNQFKDLFLGAEKRDYSRATTSQKCVRAGGKHNDLENVGFTRRHHTFFEMLGNFSFGDYFKKDAIAFAWELVTSEEWLGIPKDRLYVTIFEGDPANNVPRDNEAEKYWMKVGVPKDRIFEYGLKDNFWQMGETGPCGPCSEIFYDMGIEAAESPGVDLPFGKDEARYVEIWNLVFMQFDRAAIVDPATKKTTYKLTPLPKPCVDTGMGLERVAAVLQGKVSNFETDLFTPLIQRAAELTGLAKPPQRTGESSVTGHDLSPARESSVTGNDFSRAEQTPKNDGALAPAAEGGALKGHDLSPAREGSVTGHDFSRAEQTPQREGALAPAAEGDALKGHDFSRAEEAPKNDGALAPEGIASLVANASLRIIADHARAATFLINDGVLPSNEGRGYVLRKILRRGIRHGRLLGQEQPFLYQMVYAVRDEMKGAYPDLVDSADRVAKVVEAEEKQFDRVLKIGVARLNEELQGEFTGEKAFHLYETFGLPLDFMVDAARDAAVKFDEAGFEAARAEEQARARASWKGGSQKSASPAFRELTKTDFLGYKQLSATGAEVLAIVKDGVGVPAAAAGDHVEIVLDRTSFYADSGGQVGDTGWFLSTDGNSTIAEIEGCVLPVQGVRAHKAVLKQPLAVGDRVNTVVDGERRDSIRRNHTGTHLLHAALRQVLGTHVKQAGSSVHPDRVRFDFSHFAQVDDEELKEVESIVNREVLANARVETLEDVPIEVAVNEYHAMALFGEKYGDKVRVVKLSDGFSTELCGGTHTSATGEIGLIKIVSEGSVSSGVRRLEAISGLGSLDTFRKDFEVAKLAGQYVPSTDNLTEGLRARFAAQEDEIKQLRRELEEARMKSAAGALDGAVSGATEVKGVKVLVHRADALERGQLRTLVDNLKQKVGEGVVVLASAQPEGKVAIIAGVTPGLVKRIQAGKLVGAVAKLVGGSGGGKPDMAEAGGKDQSQIDAALKAAPSIVGDLLA
jgi:alanyl-tRNA synthetase